MRVLLTLLILLIYNFADTRANEGPPDFSEYGYIPRWQPDLPKRLHDTVYYVFGTNAVLKSDEANPITTMYFIFDKTAASDPVVQLDITLRKLEHTNEACRVSMAQRMIVLGTTTCSYDFKWSDKDDINDRSKFVDIARDYYRISAFNAIASTPSGSSDSWCLPHAYDFNETHAVYGLQFQTLDSVHCAMELLVPGQFMLFLPKSDDPYYTDGLSGDIQSTTEATAKTESAVSPLLWVVIGLAVFSLIMIVIVIYLMYYHFESRKRIARLTEMIENMRSSKWVENAGNGVAYVLEEKPSTQAVIKTAIETSPKKLSDEKKTTTNSKTAMEPESTEQTSVEKVLTEVTDRKDSTVRVKAQKSTDFKTSTQKVANLVPPPWQTERQRDVTERAPEASKKPGTVQPTQKTFATVAKTQNTTVAATAKPAPTTIFYSTRSRFE